jgi:hypothetical protein
MSEVGLFESMPDSQAAVVEIPEIRRAVRRPLVSSSTKSGTTSSTTPTSAGRPNSVDR